MGEDRFFSKLLRESIELVDRILCGGDRAYDLDEFHNRDGIEEVQTGNAIGTFRYRRQFDDAKTRGIRADDRVGCEQIVELFKECFFCFGIFNDRLDDEIAIFEIGDRRRPFDAPDDCIAFALGELPFFHELIERLRNRCEPALQRCLGDLHEDDVEACARGGLRDPVAHESGAADADRTNLQHV